MTGWSEKRKIMRRYNVTASIYDMRYAEEQEAKFYAALIHLNMKKLGIILDVGCGTGLLFHHVAGRAKVVVGVDISKESLTMAKQKARGFSTVNLILADADNLPLTEGIFAHVFAFTLVQNMPNPAATTREITRVSNDETVIVVSALKKAFSKDAFEKLLTESGLKVKAFEDKDVKCYIAVCRKA